MTDSINQVTSTEEAFTLQILHTSDQEAGVPAFQDIPGFSAVMNALEDRYENSLKLTTGDVYIGSPFFNASVDIYETTDSINSPLQGGIADILIQNELDWDAASVGNHEFTGGANTLLNLVAPNANWINSELGGAGIGEEGYPGTSFPYLANNLDYSAARLPEGLNVVENGGSPLPNTLTGSVVADVNGEQVGLIGIVTPYLKSIANTGSVEVTTLDADGNQITGTSPIDVQVDSIIANITPEVETLTNAGINKIILMTHLQESAIEQALAQKMADLGLEVDILFGGGSHQLMTSETGVPPLREDETQQDSGRLLQPFPQVFSSEDNQVIFVNSAANYRYLNQLIVTFDENGLVTDIGEESGPYATDIAGVNRLYEEEITTIEDVKAKADPEIVEIVEGVQTFVNRQDGNIFGQTDVFLNGLRSDVRTQETNLGNFLAEAQDYYAEAYLNEYELISGFDKIDISFQNGGTIRDYIGQSFIETLGNNQLVQLPPQANPEVGKEEGDISQLDLANSLRFDSDLVIGTVTAEGLWQLAEHMISSVETGNGRFGQIGGFKFSFDPNQPAFDRIQNLALTDEEGNNREAIVKDGELVVESDRIFTVVTSAFLANGGDSYPTIIENIINLTEFDEPPSLGQTGELLRPGRQQDAVAEYLSAFYNQENGQEPFAMADTPVAEDERIQNLGFREDTIFDNDSPTPPSENPLIVLGTPGNDNFDTEIPRDTGFVGENQILFTGSGNDTVDSTQALGNNRIDLGSGDDLLFGGTGDRLLAGSGNDILFLSGGEGGNFVTGGEGADQFWLSTDDQDLPETAQIITDFTAAEDVIGFAATSLTFADLDITQDGNSAIISLLANNLNLATLLNTEVSDLGESSFVFM